jgi:hypothetical protein
VYRDFDALRYRGWSGDEREPHNNECDQCKPADRAVDTPFLDDDVSGSQHVQRDDWSTPMNAEPDPGFCVSLFSVVELLFLSVNLSKSQKMEEK